jgi:hypothetical protein
MFTAHKLCHILLIATFAIHEAAELSNKHIVIVLATHGTAFTLEAVKNLLHEIVTFFTCCLGVILNEVNHLPIAQLIGFQLSSIYCKLHIQTELKIKRNVLIIRNFWRCKGNKNFTILQI